MSGELLKIDLTASFPEPQENLRMGGSSPSGKAIAVNSRYLTLGGRPWIPVMGEMHYSRCPCADWRTEILKMKAGGIGVVSTYIFWIHHEEIEGEFDWSGQRQLRRFVETCAACGLLAFVRVGPWAHGECRNGGFPDWLLKRCGSRVRKDDPEYLGHVRRLYSQIADQLRGLLWKDGGPVVGIQLENELIDNAAHLVTLKGMARAAGIDVPLYTQTGWGPAELTQDELIPVFGGYPDAFWERHVDDWARSCRKNYFFSPIRDENTIGADLLRPTKTLGNGREAQLARYPYGTCECGGGMQPAYHRRPVVQADDVAALAMVKIGSGSNLHGYYMFHGGSNPEGKLTTMQESQATGYPNDLPTISYDFQAPLREYGQLSDSYHALRPLHLFLADFGDRLAPLPLVMPETAPANVDDRQTLRWAARSDGKRAFLFVNNHQRMEKLAGHSDVQFLLRTNGGNLAVPSRQVAVASGARFFWPVNFDLADGLPLKYASVQPVCRLFDGGDTMLVFSAIPGMEPEFAFDSSVLKEAAGASHARELSGGMIILRGISPGPGCVLELSGVCGSRARVLVLTHVLAKMLYKVEWGGSERLVLSPDGVHVDADGMHLRSRKSEDMWMAIFPDADGGVRISGRSPKKDTLGIFARYSETAASSSISVEAERVQAAAPCGPARIGQAGVATPPDDEGWRSGEIWQVTVPARALKGAAEAYLVVDYIGSAGRAYVGEKLVADNFYSGQPWEIGLRRLAAQTADIVLTLCIIPLHKDSQIYIEPGFRPEFGGADMFVSVNGIRIDVELEQVAMK